MLKILSRLSRMNRDEVRTRTQQGTAKRIDLIKHRLGLPVANLSQNHGRNQGGKFFFGAEDLTRITGLLKDHLPAEVQAIVNEADEICQHRFDLLGYEKLDYGTEIDWHLDKVHGKRAPIKPWFKIPFLDFAQVGDHKVTWELNRHQHLVTLAKACVLKKEALYGVEAIEQWYSWQRANPYPWGINWCSSLEVAFRSLSWIWVRALLVETPFIPASFWADLEQALALNGWYIERYLSTYFSPNTHLLGEAVALFFIGTLCPSLRYAKRWQQLGWNLIQDQAQRQVHSDGGYFEHSLYYHVYALDFLLHTRILARRNGLEASVDFDLILNRMLDFLRALSTGGPPQGFGDDDGGRLFNARRNRNEHLTDPLVIGSILLHRSDLKSCAPITEESIWLFGEKALEQKEAKCNRAAETKSFAVSRIYVMASTEGYSERMVINSGPVKKTPSNHSHAGMLAITLSINGRSCLVDPGTLSYMEKEERDLFRSTRAHNTVTIDGANQGEPRGPFAWTGLAGSIKNQFISGKHFSLFTGSHEGYFRLKDPISHRRLVFHLPGTFWLVRDVFEGRESHHFEANWHFAPNFMIEQLEDSFIASPTDGRENWRLALLPASSSNWNSEIRENRTSAAYGISKTSPSLCLNIVANTPTEIGMLIRPFGVSGKIGKFNLIKRDENGAESTVCYTYEEPQARHFMIFSDEEARTWQLGAWKSDAQFIYYQMRRNQLVKFICCETSFVSFKEMPTIQSMQKIDYIEWSMTDGTEQCSVANPEQLIAFSALPFLSYCVENV